MTPPEPTTGEGSCRIAEWKCKASAAITVLQRKARNLLSQCWQPSARVSAHARVSVRVCVHHVCMWVCVFREDSIRREGQDQTEFETFLLPQCRLRGDREVEERPRFPEWRDGEVQGPEPQHSCPLHGLRHPHRHSLSTGLRRGAQRNQMVCVNQMAKCERNQTVIALSFLLLDDIHEH